MTAEEALALVEVALDFQRLNKVQELVFRQSWEGRSYIEIAKDTGYEHDYIKDAGAKLWRLLSKAFGEKVKKDNLQSVLKRYLRRTQVNFYRNQMIEVNLSGANLSGASLSVTNLSVERPSLTNLSKSNSFVEDLQKVTVPDERVELEDEGYDREVESDSGNQLYCWNGLHFHSKEEVKIAEALDRAGVLFCPNSKVRLTTSEGRENQEPNFLVFHEGKWGILQVGYPDAEKDEESARIFKSHGISIIQHYDATQCSENPDAVVQDFVDILNQS